MIFKQTIKKTFIGIPLEIMKHNQDYHKLNYIISKKEITII